MSNLTDLVGKKIEFDGKQVAVIGYNQTKELVNLLVLSLPYPEAEEIQEGQSYNVTSDYLSAISYKIVEG